MIVSGGKSIYGASVGILMLEARFPRIPGDIGNAESWPFPVLYKLVRGASPDRVVRRGADGLLDRFIQAGHELVADGVDGITTNCGFLSLFQDELAQALPAPVITSSLMQVDMVNRTLPVGKRAAILTISGATLTDAHLAGAGVPTGTPIGTTEGGQEFTRVILNDEEHLNVDLARQDNIEAAQALLAKHDDIGAFVLECTNMCPYARDIARSTGLPVYSMIDLVTWFHAGLSPRRFAPPG